MKQMNPTHSNASTSSTGARTPISVKCSASRGEVTITSATPSRAIAISTPIARAISLPVNHFTMALDTVIPAISQPLPKIMKPREASLAEAGNVTHQLLSQWAKLLLANVSLNA